MLFVSANIQCPLNVLFGPMPTVFNTFQQCHSSCSSDSSGSQQVPEALVTSRAIHRIPALDISSGSTVATLDQHPKKDSSDRYSYYHNIYIYINILLLLLLLLLVVLSNIAMPFYRFVHLRVNCDRVLQFSLASGLASARCKPKVLWQELSRSASFSWTSTTIISFCQDAGSDGHSGEVLHHGTCTDHHQSCKNSPPGDQTAGLAAKCWLFWTSA